MDKKLVFIDIDRTLTIAGGTTPPESAQKAVKRARERGNLVFLSTGRNLRMSLPVLDFGFDGLICMGGGYVLKGSEVIYDRSMDTAETERIIDIMRGCGILCTPEGLDDVYWADETWDFIRNLPGGDSELETWLTEMEKNFGAKHMSDFTLDVPVYKFVIMTDRRENVEKAGSILHEPETQ